MARAAPVRVVLRKRRTTRQRCGQRERHARTMATCNSRKHKQNSHACGGVEHIAPPPNGMRAPVADQHRRHGSQRIYDSHNHAARTASAPVPTTTHAYRRIPIPQRYAGIDATAVDGHRALGCECTSTHTHTSEHSRIVFTANTATIGYA